MHGRIHLSSPTLSAVRGMRGDGQGKFISGSGELVWIGDFPRLDQGHQVGPEGPTGAPGEIIYNNQSKKVFIYNLGF